MTIVPQMERSDPLEEKGGGAESSREKSWSPMTQRSHLSSPRCSVSVHFGFLCDGRVGVNFETKFLSSTEWIKDNPFLDSPRANMMVAGVQTREPTAIFPQVSSYTQNLWEMRLKMEAKLRSKDLLSLETRLPTNNQEEPHGKKLLVEMDRGDGKSFTCAVYVNRKHQRRLPWLGGYRIKQNGTRLHHATQQTDPTKPSKQPLLMISRETMKPFMRRHSEQGAKDSWTQMDKPGIFLDNSEDYELIPGPYFTADDWVQVRIDAAIIIQKYTRRDIARRTAARMRAYAAKRKEFWIEQEKKRKQEADDHLHYEIHRRMNPRTGEDFEILYTELATWCAQELKAISDTGVTGMERRNAVKELLFKEIKLLQTIDKLRCKAAKENRKGRINTTMEKMSTPKIWEMKNGSIVHVRTLGTARAVDLMHLYHALAKPTGTNDERMGVLGYVKWTVQVFNYPLTREILDLIEREADMMNRGRSPRTLSGLRQRILNLFLQFVETPDFNPEAVGFQYVPPDFDYGANQASTRRPGTDKFT